MKDLDLQGSQGSAVSEVTGSRGHWEGVEIKGNKISRPPFFDYQRAETMLARQSVKWFVFVVLQQGQNSRSS
jgi:hypothetical protein